MALRDRAVGTGGGGELDVAVGHLHQRLFHAVALDDLAVVHLGTERLGVVGDGGLEVLDGDGDVVDLGEQHPPSETDRRTGGVKTDMDDDPPPVTEPPLRRRRAGSHWCPETACDRALPTRPFDFDDFYRTHRADAVRWAIALVGDRAVAEELAQDSLVAVGAKLRTIDEPGRRTCGARW